MNSSIHCLTSPKATLLERPSLEAPHTHFGPGPCRDVEGQDHHMATSNCLFLGRILMPWFSLISISFTEKPPRLFLVSVSGFTEHLLELPKIPVVACQVCLWEPECYLCAIALCHLLAGPGSTPSTQIQRRNVLNQPHFPSLS